MNHATAIRIFAVGAALALGSTALGQSLTLLGNPPGYTVSGSLGISDDGRVVTGRSGGVVDPLSFVALDGLRQDIMTPAGLEAFYSLNVSGDGQYLAIQGVSSSSSLGQAGRYRIADGSYMLIGTNLGASWDHTTSAINRNGTAVAGWSFNINNFAYKAWYWSGTGNAVQITVGNDEPALTSDISSDGRFICGYNPVSPAAPFVFDRQSNSVARLTGVGQARAINSAGNIVVGNALDSFGYSRPARWDNGVLQFITDAYQNMGDFTARDVSADGSITTCRGVPGFQGPISMIWSAGTGLIESKAYFEAFGVQFPAGWDVGSELFVSADGRTFTGSLYQGSVAQPFVITIPTPGVAALGFAGALMAGRRRRA